MTTTRIRDEALARGSLGPAALEMMIDVFSAELPRFRGLAAQDEIGDFVNGFFLDKGAGYANAVVAASDDEAAKRLTRKWAVHWLVDQARRLPLGALRNRLEKRLERSSQFERSAADHYWYLAGGDDTDRPVSDADLRALASTAYVEVTRMPNGEGVRLGRTGELEELLRRLLEAAGRLHISDITRICADRFPSALQVGDAYSSTVDADWDYLEETTPGRDTISAMAGKRGDERSAEELLPLLTDGERAAIRFANDVSGLAAELGIGRSSAYSLIKKLRVRLVELAGESERSRQVMTALLALVVDQSAVVPSADSDRKDSRAI